MFKSRPVQHFVTVAPFGSISVWDWWGVFIDIRSWKKIPVRHKGGFNFISYGSNCLKSHQI